MPGSDDKAPKMKSAYELALERMDQAGIERPDADHFDEEIRGQMATARSQAEARTAELEILHQKRLAAVADPGERDQLEEDYRRDRRRIEEDRDRKLARLRASQDG